LSQGAESAQRPRNEEKHNLITGHELWICWDNYRRAMLAQDRGGIPPNVKCMISSAKPVLATCFPRHGFASIELHSQGTRHELPLFTEMVLQIMANIMSVCHSKTRAKDIHFHGPPGEDKSPTPRSPSCQSPLATFPQPPEGELFFVMNILSPF
jgi:hypothetical protein